MAEIAVEKVKMFLQFSRNIVTTIEGEYLCMSVLSQGEIPLFSGHEQDLEQVIGPEKINIAGKRYIVRESPLFGRAIWVSVIFNYDVNYQIKSSEVQNVLKLFEFKN